MDHRRLLTKQGTVWHVLTKQGTVWRVSTLQRAPMRKSTCGCRVHTAGSTAARRSMPFRYTSRDRVTMTRRPGGRRPGSGANCVASTAVKAGSARQAGGSKVLACNLDSKTLLHVVRARAANGEQTSMGGAWCTSTSMPTAIHQDPHAPLGMTDTRCGGRHARSTVFSLLV